ncbi:hypothetical protein RESH_02830 [Rhodopirellula europaea SH398]|uniref:Uncharacterized protein n=1 Tax=Rhodopirellula europaea SH398 TaxID=1263868 RepID=M5S4Y2_9BACT|nr:hypothetical protein RESH_02830 [Rhodopirellula europaea SH398]
MQAARTPRSDRKRSDTVLRRATPDRGAGQIAIEPPAARPQTVDRHDDSLDSTLLGENSLGPEKVASH